MGCCVSTNGIAAKNRDDFQQGSESSLKQKSILENRAPPPSIEEETVKEVLSETPNHKPKTHIEQPFLDEKLKSNGFKNEFLVFQEEKISEPDVSDVCSLSLSETVSTTTFNDDCGVGEEVKPRVKRSPVAKLPSKKQSFSGDFGPKRVGKSPNRRTEQSPDKRNNAGRGGGGTGSARLVQGKESSVGRNGYRHDPKRKDPGEKSGRRSRSPATNRSAMGRSRSAGRVNGSPDRVKKGLPGSGGSCMEDKWPSTSNANGTRNELLENPLVSLECFIFL